MQPKPQPNSSTEPALRIAIASSRRFHMYDLARQMVRLGQHPLLYTGLPLCKIDPDLRPYARTRAGWTLMEAIRQRIGPAPRTTWWSDRALEDMRHWVARTIDDVDIMDALAGVGEYAGRVLQRSGKPWICHRSSTHILTQKRLLEEEHERWGAAPPYFDMGKPMQNCLAEYAEADAIVVPSHFARRSFLEHGIASDKLYVQPFGVDLSMFRPLPKEDDTFRILYVGSLSLRKGIGYLLDAVRPLVKKRRVELWLVGPVERDTRTLLSRNADLFTYHGTQTRARLAWYYSQGSLLVLPSIEEGLACVQAQAMACGLPVIGTPNSGAEDLFTDGVEGFIVPIRSPEAIRERIEWLICRPEHREAMGAAALRRVRDLSGWDDYGRRCLAMYRDVIARKCKTAVSSSGSGYHHVALS